MTTAIAAAAVAALSASQAPGVTPHHVDSGSSAADRSDDDVPDTASGPDYYTDLPPLDSPTDTASPSPGSGTGGGGAAEAGIPATVLDAYKKAEAELASSKPGCNLRWQLLAAIGKVESGQASGGNVDANGTMKNALKGPPLDGNGFAKITDTDGGLYDGDTVHDRAVGPMQFIPSTWEWAGRDGNGDGKKDPFNVYDAALAAGHYLCRNDWDLSNANDLNRAILSYNNSSDYLAKVLSWMEYYRKGTYEVPDGTGVLPTSPSGGGTGGTGGSTASPTPSPTPPAPGGSPSPKPGSGGSANPSPKPTDPTTPADPKPTPTPTPTPTDSVTKLADADTGTLGAMAGDAFAERVQVRAKDKAGKGVAKVKVRFRIIGSTDARFAGDATSAVVTTTAAGTATAPKLTAGEKTGAFTVRATVVGSSVTGLDYTAKVTERVADTLARTSDKELTCVAGGTFDDGAVTLKATYKDAVADGVVATATLVKAEDDPSEATTGPSFKDADGKTVRTLKGLKTDKDGLLALPKLYADDATGTFLLRVTTAGGATVTVELKVTAAPTDTPSDGASGSPAASESPSASASPSA